MTSKKKYTQIAKVMQKASLKDGQVDPRLVDKVLKNVISQKPAGLMQILKAYKNQIAAKIAQEELIIEFATLPSLSKSALLQKTGAKRIVFKKNPEIIFGARIKNGDWIWEETLDSKLNKIKGQ